MSLMQLLINRMMYSGKELSVINKSDKKVTLLVLKSNYFFRNHILPTPFHSFGKAQFLLYFTNWIIYIYVHTQ